MSQNGASSFRRARKPLCLQPEWLEKRNAVLSKWRKEVCSGGDLTEVEIISLVEEKIPRYTLRADTLTEFTGYENKDWFVPSPALQISEDVDLNLSPELIRETLNYFILCSNRVSQMTKTYNDIEAITRLLEEKERDLELTARIGKELLQHNNKLETNVVSLETELKLAQEKITQLTHELLKKNELIQVLTNDVDDPTSEPATPTAPKVISADLMQQRISKLEEENKSLKKEYEKLAIETDVVEEQEQNLIRAIEMQLANVSMDVNVVNEELEKAKDENRMQHELISGLTKKLSNAEILLQKLTLENEEMSTHLNIYKETQNSLTTELAECKDRYNEVSALLKDTQEELKRQRRRGAPTVRSGLGHSMPLATTDSLQSELESSLYFDKGGKPRVTSSMLQSQPDSLQSELESSLYSELSLDSGIAGIERIPPYKRVFETVRCASRTSTTGPMYPRASTGLGTYNSYSGLGGASNTVTCSSARQQQPRMSLHQLGGITRYSSASLGSSLGYPTSLDSAGHSDNESIQTDSEDGYPGISKPGIPGVPGATELESALRRLSPAEVSARRAYFASGANYAPYDTDSYLPFGCRTPDSIMSTGSSNQSGHSISNWRLPEKLQIVKPLEGSQTLHHWSRLATPTLGGLLDDRPGVKIRGGRALEDIGLETYTLSDLEEDDEVTHPGKRFESSSCIFTYTTSTIMHPDDETHVTESVRGSRVSSVCPSECGSAPPTPRNLSRRNSTSTFSTTFGLAKMLNERGIKAVTPSCVNTPAFTPTATPCNSPDGTPPETRDVSPVRVVQPLQSFQGILSQGAELFRRTFGVEETPAVQQQPPSRRRSKTSNNSNKYPFAGIRIVEQIERIGLESIMTNAAQPVSPLAIQGSLCSQRNATSPMTQLTRIKGTGSSGSSVCSDLSSVESLAADRPRKPSQAINRASRERTPASAMGIPGKPGSGQLNRRLEQLAARQRTTRPDLGTVGPVNGPRSSRLTTPEPQQQQQQQQSALGTISSLLFGRKGGLL